jgi:hypothetical protein
VPLWAWACLPWIVGQGADDWPHLRGPNGDGVRTGERLSAIYADDSPPLLWRVELGQGYSGFSLSERQLFTQFQDRLGQHLLCLDAESGVEKWRLRYDSAWQRNGAYPGPYATPTVGDGSVCFASPSGIVGAADVRSGRLLWSKNLLAEFKGHGAGFGYACTPLIDEHRVFFPVGGKGAGMVALDVRDGSLLWKAGDDPGSYCGASLIRFEGRRLIVGYLRNTLVLHDAETGRILMRRVLSSDYDEHSAWPLYREPYLAIAAPFKAGMQRFRLEADSEGGIVLRPTWHCKDMSNDVLSSVLHDGCVFGFDLQEAQARVHRTSRGEFRCVDFDTGKVRWSAPNVPHSSVLLADDKLVLLDDQGILRLAKASRESYQELSRFQALPDGPCWTPPSLSRGRLFVRNAAEVRCYWLGAEAKFAAIETSSERRPRQWSWSWASLVGQEPDYPNDMPSRGDWLLHLGVSFALLAVAGIGSQWRGEWMIWTVLLAAIATPIAGHAFATFQWTWPLSLFALFQRTIDTIVSSEGNPAKPRGPSRLAATAFLLACGAYWWICRELGLSVYWTFLFGFPAAFLLSVAAACNAGWRRGLLAPLAFATYFCACMGLMAWRSA